MTKIDIVSGFLGAGKTTLIKKMLAEAYKGEKLVLIENEFGEISIDGGFLKDSGVQISEMSSGCICCSLVGDFATALKEVKAQFEPDRILIEPSGVGKLSDVIVAVEDTVKDVPDMKLNSFVTVADAGKVKVYMKNFGEFYNNQIESAGTIILSRTQKISQEKLEAAVALLREKNPDAAILTTPWDELDGMTVLAAVEKILAEGKPAGTVVIANHNTETQIVLSGDAGGLAAAEALCKAAGAKVIPLKVSVANHCPLIADAVKPFFGHLAGFDFRDTSVPMYFNVTAALEHDRFIIRNELMPQQLVSRVRWYEIIQAMLANGVELFVELGPGKVLTGLMKKILPKGSPVQCMQADTPETMDAVAAAIQS